MGRLILGWCDLAPNSQKTLLSGLHLPAPSNRVRTQHRVIWTESAELAADACKLVVFAFFFGSLVACGHSLRQPHEVVQCFGDGRGLLQHPRRIVAHASLDWGRRKWAELRFEKNTSALKRRNIPGSRGSKHLALYCTCSEAR